MFFPREANGRLLLSVKKQVTIKQSSITKHSRCNMKYIRLNQYQVALVFANGAYSRMLEAGNHFLGWREEALVYQLDKPFTAPCELNILLKDAKLAEKLEVVNV